MAPEDIIHYFDIVVIGEGEDSLLELIQGRNLEDIDGIAFKSGRKVLFNKRRPFKKI